MKITFEIPDDSIGAVLSIIHGLDCFGLKFVTRTIATGELKDGNELKVETENKNDSQ